MKDWESQPLLVGHTVDGEPIYVDMYQCYLPLAWVVQLEVGNGKTIRLDHLDPELIPALARSLKPAPTEQKGAA